MNPKMHFLHFSVIKIAKDYLRESIPTVQTLLVQNQYSYSLTKKKPFTDFLPQLNSPGHKRMNPELFPLSKENKQELWVEDFLKSRKTSSLPVFPKAPSSSLFFSYLMGQMPLVKYGPRLPRHGSHNRLNAGQGNKRY